MLTIVDPQTVSALDRVNTPNVIVYVADTAWPLVHLTPVICASVPPLLRRATNELLNRGVARGHRLATTSNCLAAGSLAIGLNARSVTALGGVPGGSDRSHAWMAGWSLSLRFASLAISSIVIGDRTLLFPFGDFGTAVRFPPGGPDVRAAVAPCGFTAVSSKSPSCSTCLLTVAAFPC